MREHGPMGLAALNLGIVIGYFAPVFDKPNYSESAKLCMAVLGTVSFCGWVAMLLVYAYPKREKPAGEGK